MQRKKIRCFIRKTKKIFEDSSERKEIRWNIGKMVCWHRYLFLIEFSSWPIRIISFSERKKLFSIKAFLNQIFFENLKNFWKNDDGEWRKCRNNQKCKIKITSIIYFFFYFKIKLKTTILLLILNITVRFYFNHSMSKLFFCLKIEKQKGCVNNLH